MTLIPLVPTRSQWTDPRTGLLTRGSIEYLNALRLALGSGTTTPQAATDGLEPVSAAMVAPDALAPVAGVSEAFSELEPV